MNPNSKNDLLSGPPNVINVGLEGFAQDLENQGVDVIQIEWSPPAGGDPELARILSMLGT